MQSDTTNSTINENEVFSQVFIRGNNVCYVTPFKKDGEEESDNNTGFRINEEGQGNQTQKDLGEDQIN